MLGALKSLPRPRKNRRRPTLGRVAEIIEAAALGHLEKMMEVPDYLSKIYQHFAQK